MLVGVNVGRLVGKAEGGRLVGGSVGLEDSCDGTYGGRVGAEVPVGCTAGGKKGVPVECCGGGLVGDETGGR